MAFDIALTPTFKSKVEVWIANGQCGQDKSEFEAEFLRVEADELEELFAAKQIVSLNKVLVGFSKVVHDGQEVPFNATNKARMLAIPEARVALSEAFWKSYRQAREKN